MKTCGTYKIMINIFSKKKKKDFCNNLLRKKKYFVIYIYIYIWGSKIWARNLGPGTTFYQQYAQGEEITEDRCN